MKIPILSTGEIDAFISEILPDLPALPPLERHPAAALRRTLVRRTLRAALLAAVLGGGLAAAEWLAPWSVAILAGLIAFGAARGFAEYRALAHAMTGSVVVARHGALSLTTEVSPLTKVQAVFGRAGPFQRRLDLGSLDVHVAGARITVRDAGAGRIADLHTALVSEAARAG